MSKHIAQFPPLFLSRKDAALFLSISESTLDELVAKGNLPKPRKLSPGRSGWLTQELTFWGQSRPISDLLPPFNTGLKRNKNKQTNT